jgi:hypothetical protein
VWAAACVCVDEMSVCVPRLRHFDLPGSWVSYPRFIWGNRCAYLFTGLYCALLFVWKEIGRS